MRKYQATLMCLSLCTGSFHDCVLLGSMVVLHFNRSLGCLVSTTLEELATQIFVAELSERARRYHWATRDSLCTVLRSKLSRYVQRSS
jgi:hypothetical protein